MNTRPATGHRARLQHTAAVGTVGGRRTHPHAALSAERNLQLPVGAPGPERPVVVVERGQHPRRDAGGASSAMMKQSTFLIGCHYKNRRWIGCADELLREGHDHQRPRHFADRSQDRDSRPGADHGGRAGRDRRRRPDPRRHRRHLDVRRHIAFRSR